MNKTRLRQIAEKVQATEHSDYRTFLQAVYAAAKAEETSYSYAKLSTDLGLGSSNAHSVIHGRRPLTEKAGLKIAEELKLNAVQRRYLLALIRQERSDDVGEREAAFAERLELKRKLLPTELSRSQLAFFEHWYHAAILELLRLDRGRDQPEWLAAELRPEVSVGEVKASLALLTELGYLAPSAEKGRLFPTEATISTGNEVRGLALTSYHRQMLALAVRALDSIAQEDRDISAITVAVSADLQAKMKDEIIALRKRFLKLAEEENATTGDIYQLNIQLFPLAKKTKDRQ